MIQPVPTLKFVESGDYTRYVCIMVSKYFIYIYIYSKQTSICLLVLFLKLENRGYMQLNFTLYKNFLIQDFKVRKNLKKI